jgi:hypothetical protein
MTLGLGQHVTRAFVRTISLLVAVSACSGGGDTPPPSHVTATRPGVGSVGCNVDTDCFESYCSSGTCVSDCSTSSTASCSTGCDAVGRCLTAPILPSTGFQFNSNADFDPGCIERDVRFDPVTPTVMLLIDQSGSMEQLFGDDCGGGGCLSRWDTLVNTLATPETSLLRSLQSSVRFGLALYTSEGGFGSGAPPRECPMIAQVSIAISNFSRMSGVLQQARPVRDTPTAESVQRVTETLRGFNEEGPKFIILATDGEPDTCADPDAHDETTRALSVQAVSDAYAEGITTRIISVGDEVGADHLKDLAVAGLGGDQTAEAFTALNTNELEDAFNTIINGVRSCDFTLEGRVRAADASRGTVTFDGNSLAYGDGNGWTMTDERTVRVQGTACDSLLNQASSDLSMRFPCDAIFFLQ